MVEIELKFQVPATRRAAVQRAVATPAARTTRLRAQYFDTPGRHLAAAQMALRLRLEGDTWVQTLKGRGDGHLHRLEHEVALGRQRGTPALDIQRHAGTPAGQALLDALGDEAAALQVVFETDVSRTHRIVRSGGAQVELALDVGELRAGGARRPLHELELELKAGPVAGLLDLAGRWVARHGLWLDVRTKSERGDQLARGVSAGPAAHAHAPALKAGMAPSTALRAMVGACLEQILPNVAELAKDETQATGTPGHLHQARVGLRRLRSALRLFGEWAPSLAAGAPASWDLPLATLSRQLGAARDQDVLAASITPALQLAGAPLARAPAPAPVDDIAQALRAPAVTQLLLALMGFAHGGEAAAPEKPGKPGDSLKKRARTRLKALHRQLQKDAAKFRQMDDDTRHRTRKRLKRLRYGVELIAGLYPPKAVKRYLAQLRPAQEALGLYNDLTVAEAAFRQLLPTDPRAWFALGWLAARRVQLLDNAARALAGLETLDGFWRQR